MKLYPTPNETPAATNGYNNFNYVPAEPQNRWEATGKVDYAISDNDKVTGSYTYQRENDIAPISIWWSAPWTLPYPSPAASKTNAYVILTNYTHVFNPTTTNEFVFTWSHFVNPYTLSDPSKVSRSTNAFNVQGLFGHTTAQIPAFEGPWGGSLANLGSSSSPAGPSATKKGFPPTMATSPRSSVSHFEGRLYRDSSQNTQNNTLPGYGYVKPRIQPILHDESCR